MVDFPSPSNNFGILHFLFVNTFKLLDFTYLYRIYRLCIRIVVYLPKFFQDEFLIGQLLLDVSRSKFLIAGKDPGVKESI